MAQTAITTKFTLTTLTGTSGTTFNPVGRDANQVISWRGVISSDIPSSDIVLTASGQKTADAWKSQIKLVAPVMKTLSGGDSAGYAAVPAVADNLIFDMRVRRCDVMSQAAALQQLDQFAYALLTDAALRKQVVGYAPADA